MTEPSQSRATLELHHEIEQFYYAEAALLDARKFDEWLTLFTDDVHYFVPVRSLRYRAQLDQEFSGPDEVAHFDDTKELLAMRVGRLMTGFAWADEPASRTRHFVSNVRARSAQGADGNIEATASILVYHGHGEHHVRLYSGARHDVLRASEAGFRIAARTVYLDATVLPANLGVLF